MFFLPIALVLYLFCNQVSQMEQDQPGTTGSRRRRRHRTEHSGKPNPYRRLEDIITGNLLKVIGILFIFAVVVYSVGSADKLKGFIKMVGLHEGIVIQPSSDLQSALTNTNQVQPKPLARGTSEVTGMVLWGSLSTVFFCSLLLLSIRMHRREVIRILIPVFFTLAFFLTRIYGWQVHVLFPMALVFSSLVFYSGVKLHSWLAGKWNYLVFWAFFTLWWILKIAMGGNSALLPVFFIYGSLLYLFYLYVGVYGGFKGHNEYSAYTESALKVINISLFFLMGLFSLVRCGYGEYIWVFSICLAAVNVLVLYLAEKSGKKVSPAPYVFPVAVILSLIFPFLFKMNFLILFTAVFSCLLLFYSKYSGDKVAVITALVSIAIMLLTYFKDWSLQYIPLAFFGNVLDNRVMMTRGLVAGMVIFPAMLINGQLIRKLHVDFSKEWFSRLTYQRLFRGINLCVLYLSAYWVVNYFILTWTENPGLNYLSWFGYNSVFFIISIPLLAARKSKFLNPAISMAVLFSLAYPSLIHLTNIDLRNEILAHHHDSDFGFWFHYPVVLLFIAEIFILYNYIQKAFAGERVVSRLFLSFLLLMGLFILLSETDHLMIWTGAGKGITIEEVWMSDRVIPYTLVMLAYSAVVLTVGLIWRDRFLRAAGLVLLLFTLAKMMYIDVRALSGMKRSLTLFAVGIVILTLSFMYPRIKRYFRRREHEARGISGNQHRRHRRPSSVPDSKYSATEDETH
jgi:hypothetical protein